MTNFIAFSITGIVVGAVYAVVASGLVVTYTTSGIFNFAHGAIGMFMAFAYWELRVSNHWPAPLALIAVLFIMAPLFGALVERVLMRNIKPSDTGTSLMVTLGLLLFLIGVAYSRWKPDSEDQPRAFKPEFYNGQTFRTVFEADIQSHDPALGCPERPVR